MILPSLLASFLGAALLTWTVNWLTLIPWRRSAGAHWTERARMLYTARKSAAGNILVIPVNSILAHRLLLGEAAPHWIVVAAVSWLGVVAGTRSFDRAVYPNLDLQSWIHECLGGILLRYSGFILLGVGLALMPHTVDWRMVLIATGYLAATVLLNWRFDTVLRWLRLVEPASARLDGIVGRVSARMAVPVRQVWLLRGAAANAFALPFNRQLLFGKRLVEALSDDELAAICAHELGHLTESKFTLFVRLLGSLAFMPWLFVSPLIQAFGAVGFLIPCLAMILWLYGFKIISRRLEVRADAIAHGQEEDTGTYARALEKLHELNQLPAVFPAREQTHPHLYDRLLAAGVTPSYPRPDPPPAMEVAGHLPAILLGVLVVLSINAARHFR